jgi:hypothetical protein
MQFMLMVYENRERFAQFSNADKLRVSVECDAWHERLRRSGHAVAMTRLQPVASASTVRKNGKQFFVSDGPFAESKELLGGFAILDCRDHAEATELAKTFPVLDVGLSVEIRPVMTSEEDYRRWQST